MSLMRKWNEFMGPKDERLVAEENKAYRLMANIFLVGTALTLYYGIALHQVSDITEHPVFTPLGESVDLTQILLTLTILVACIPTVVMQTRQGFFTSRTRLSGIDHVPWGYVAVVSLLGGLAVGILACGMRVIAEIQIVGLGDVMWFGDFAIGIVFFVVGFVLCFAAISYTIHDAIKRRLAIEDGLYD